VENGNTGELWLWLKKLLSDELDYVTFEGAISVVLSGVTQGSILVALLLAISMTLANAIIYSNSFLFADDAKMIKTVTSTLQSREIELDLEGGSSGCKKWNPASKIECNSFFFSYLTRRYLLARSQ